MSIDKFTFVGECEHNEFAKILYGSINLNRADMEGTFCFDKGILGDSLTNQSHKVKGYIRKEINPYDNENHIFTLSIVKYPIIPGPNNVMYNLERILSRKNCPKILTFAGRYFGKEYHNVEIEVPEASILEGLTDLPIADYLFTDMKYDETKGFYTMIELEALNKKKTIQFKV